MRLTIEYLQIHFTKYNEQYFFSKLPMPSFELMNTVSTLGCYCPPTKEHDHLIRVTEAYEGKERFFQNILIHEMIHYYLHYIGDDDTGWAHHHGKNFKREADRINKDGWSIRRLCSANEMKMVRLEPKHVSFRVNTPRDVKSLLDYQMSDQDLIHIVLNSRNKDKCVILWLSYPILQRMVYAEMLEDDCSEELREQRCKAIVKAYKLLIKFNYGNSYHLYVLHSDLSHFYQVTGRAKLAETEYNEASKLKDSQPTSTYRLKGKVIHPISEWELGE